MKQPLLTLPILLALLPSAASAATTIPLTVNLSEAVTVTGTPQIAVDVGGTTRYATYTAGSGTSTLTFTLTPQAGDVDLDGITLSSPIDLNGGTMKDAAGNNAALTFTPPNTTGIKVNYPSLGMDFIYDADGRYTLNGTAYNDLASFLSAAGGSFTRSTTATYYDSTGTLQTAASGAPRFDYDPVAHTQKGILLEESRTNGALYSEQFDNAAWTKNSLTVTPNAIAAPDGTTTADLVAPTGVANSYLGHTNITFAAGAVVSRSIYAKAGTGSKVYFEHNDGGLGNTLYNLSTQIATPAAGVTASMTAVGNGWYRLNWSKTFTNSSATASGRIIYIDTYGAGTAGNGVYLWGAQTEVGMAPSSYIQTTSAAVTRAADVLTLPTGTWFNAAEGSAFVEGATTNTTSAQLPALFSLDDTTATNRIQLRRVNGTNVMHLAIVSGGSTILAANGVTAWSTSAPHKFSMVYKSAATKTYMNGVFQTSYSGAFSPPAITQLQLGKGPNSGYLNGPIKRFKYYPAQLIDAQLQQLTQ